MLRIAPAANGPFIAIDPGTKWTGIALFDNGKPVHWALLSAPAARPAYERINIIMQAILEYHAQHAQRAAAIAAEKTTAMERRRPSPELATLLRSIRSWTTGKATKTKNKMTWCEYNPSTVVAAVSLRGLPAKDSKSRISQGVHALYGDIINAPGAPMPTPLPQDVIDAIAVGHCHLSALINQSILPAPEAPAAPATPA